MSDADTENPERSRRVETLSFRLEPELLAAVKAAADREARSVGGYVRALLLEKLRGSA